MNANLYVVSGKKKKKAIALLPDCPASCSHSLRARSLPCGYHVLLFQFVPRYLYQQGCGGFATVVDGHPVIWVSIEREELQIYSLNKTKSGVEEIAAVNLRVKPEHADFQGKPSLRQIERFGWNGVPQRTKPSCDSPSCCQEGLPANCSRRTICTPSSDCSGMMKTRILLVQSFPLGFRLCTSPLSFCSLHESLMIDRQPTCGKLTEVQK